MSSRAIRRYRRSWWAAFALPCVTALPAIAQDPPPPSPFPESSLEAIRPVESLPPPTNDEPSPLLEPGGPWPEANAAPEDLDAPSGVGPQVVRLRYPNGAVKVERQVALNPDGDYVNHGRYRLLDPKGVAIAEGAFRYGKAEGPWRRWISPAASESFRQAPYAAFQAPFRSSASFREGRLQGTWVLADRAQRKIFEIEFDDGQRQGRAVWYFPQGDVLREAFYADGLPHGPQRIWRSPGAQPKTYQFEHGRRVELKENRYANKQPKSRGAYYHPLLRVESEDSWWQSRLAEFQANGQGYRHGVWRVWHPNGQLQMQGSYEKDKPVGQFSWWHANGQLALQGAYTEGKRDGEWRWWHANGLKRSSGEYFLGAPAGDWAWWNEQGKLSRQADFPGRLRDLDERMPGERPSSPASAPVSTRESRT